MKAETNCESARSESAFSDEESYRAPHLPEQKPEVEEIVLLEALPPPNPLLDPAFYSVNEKSEIEEQTQSIGGNARRTMGPRIEYENIETEYEEDLVSLLVKGRSLNVLKYPQIVYARNFAPKEEGGKVNSLSWQSKEKEKPFSNPMTYYKKSITPRPYYTRKTSTDRTLCFESRFESGNLEYAIKMTDQDYI